jgi:hypothetical protein
MASTSTASAVALGPVARSSAPALLELGYDWEAIGQLKVAGVIP